MDTTKKQSGFFYGWIIAVVSFIALFFTIGVAVTAFSSTSAYVVEKWGISQTQVTSMVTFRTLISVLAMYVCGVYYRKLSLRVGFALGVGMGAVGYVIFALSNGLVGGWIAMFFIGASHGFGGMYAVSLLAEYWFLKAKATVLGVATTASGFCTIFMPRLLVGWVENHSLSYAFWMTAILFAIATVILFLLVRDKPEDMGLTRYGEGGPADKSKRTVTEKYEPRMAECILLLVACVCIGGICYTQGQVRTLALTTVGWDAAKAAGALSYYGIFIIVGKLIYGPISDRWSQRQVGWIFYLLIGAAHVLYAFAAAPWFGTTHVIINTFLYSMGGPICTVGLALYGAEMANKGDKVKWIRNYLVMYNVGALLLTPLAGMSADRTGNYVLCFWVLAGMAAVGAICEHIAYTRAYKRYNKIHGGQEELQKPEKDIA